MANPKIEKVNTAIEKLKAQIADFQAKLKDLENQKIMLENEEIVAMFRREKFNEDDLAELRQKKKERQIKTVQPTEQERLEQAQPAKAEHETAIIQTPQTGKGIIFDESDNE